MSKKSNEYNVVILKSGKERPIQKRHHWIFSGAIANHPKFADGDILPVYSSRDELLGHAYFNHATDIAGRMVSFGDADPWEYLASCIENAITLRKRLFDRSKTNAYRVINGEGDGVAGLIVDQYADVLVLQSSTVGMDKLKPRIVDLLIDLLNPRSIIERSDIASRNKEGLPPAVGKVYGEDVEDVEILENGIKMLVSPLKGHKTGYYLDQREMRALVGDLAADRRVLNCFSYTGGFSLYAARGGAVSTTSVDISAEALALAARNFELNNFGSENNFVTADVFKFLRENELNYDLIILDPPAFAKKRSDVAAAERGYRDINRVAISKMPPQSVLVTCSCSYHVDQELFERLVLQAAVDAKRQVKIIHKHRLAMDHALNIFHSEADYLKSLVLWVE